MGRSGKINLWYCLPPTFEGTMWRPQSTSRLSCKIRSPLGVCSTSNVAADSGKQNIESGINSALKKRAERVMGR